MSRDITSEEVASILDRAIVHCARFVPVEHRNPTPGGGNVLTVATGLLVATRAVVEAIMEDEKKAGPSR